MKPWFARVFRPGHGERTSFLPGAVQAVKRGSVIGAGPVGKLRSEAGRVKACGKAVVYGRESRARFVRVVMEGMVAVLYDLEAGANKGKGRCIDDGSSPTPTFVL